ncbi:MAG: DUF120 domain-containing protein [Candidatus Bathyarchaeia archaeon]
MKSITIKGAVFSGEGMGQRFVRISWAKKQIQEKLCFEPYPGTLNVCISEMAAKKLRKILKRSKSIEIIPAKGFLSARCFKALIKNKIEGAIIVPMKSNYPSSVLEILAPVHLRTTLSLKDGDNVEVAISLETSFQS